MLIFFIIPLLGCFYKDYVYAHNLKEFNVPIIVSTGACKSPGLYLAGDSPCSYRECSLDPTPTPEGNYGLLAVTRDCAPGTGVPMHYSGGFTNPCVNLDITCGQGYEFIDIPKMLEPIINKYTAMEISSKKSKESVEEKKISAEPISNNAKISKEIVITAPSSASVESVEVDNMTNDKIILEPSPTPTPKEVQTVHAKQGSFWSKRKSNYSHKTPHFYQRILPRRRHHGQLKTYSKIPPKFSHPKPSMPSRPTIQSYRNQPSRTQTSRMQQQSRNRPSFKQRNQPGNQPRNHPRNEPRNQRINLPRIQPSYIPKVVSYHLKQKFPDYSPNFYSYRPVNKMVKNGKIYYFKVNN